MSDNEFASPMPNRKYFESAQQAILNSNENKTLRKTYEHIKQSKNKTQSKNNERILNNLVIGANIGVGTFSKVCVAKHIPTNQKVAVKIIDKSKIETAADLSRLQREIKIMRKVRHPNIIQLYEIIQTKKYIYLVTEYAARGELFEHIISQQKLTQLEASRFLLQLVDAIQHIHKIGVAHRDLKPENLLLDHKFNLKVIDFGLSNIYGKDHKLKTACGSPCYACPQMINCQQYDGLKADIWSIGIVLYAMCFGYLPFENDNTSVLYNMIRGGQFQIPESASNYLSSILSRMLCVDPNQRATIKEIRAHSFCSLTFPSLLTKPSQSSMGIIFNLSDIPYQAQIQNQMKTQIGINTANLKQQIENNRHSQLTCTYYLILQRNLRENNQSLLHYYSKKLNQINRYAIIEKVKENFDRRLIKNKERTFLDSIKLTSKNNGRAFSPKTVTKAYKTIEKYKNIERSHKVNGDRQQSPKKYRQLQKHRQFGNFAPDNTIKALFDADTDHKNKNTNKSSGKKNSNMKGGNNKCGKKTRNKTLPKNTKLQF